MPYVRMRFLALAVVTVTTMEYYMSTLKLVLVGVIAVGIAGAARSAPSDPFVAAAVKAVPDKVTLQRPGLGPLAAYEVTLTNSAANSLNRVTFGGTALLITNATPSPIAIDSVIKASSSGQDPACTTHDVNVVTCNVGTLAPKSTLVFYVVVKSPVAGNSITFDWSFSGAEGGSLTGNSFYTVTGLASTGLVDALTSTGKKNAQSFVPSTTGLTLFTGGGLGLTYPYVGSPATEADPYTTTVVIPSGVTTTATIVETEAASVVCQPGQCFVSQLTIPEATYSPLNPLKIFLRRDATTTSGNINNSVVFYTPDGSATPVPLEACDLTTPAGPLNEFTPCIYKRTVITKTIAPGVEWIKDWQFEIWALGNGKYAN